MMKMTYFNKEANVKGGSYIGNSHIALNLPNQDSYMIRKTLQGVMMCVCDGVGSERYSDKGSKAACKAAFKAFKMYALNRLDKENVGSFLEKEYRKNIKKKYKQFASTTCLFVFVLNDGRILIGQSGDGVILIKKDEKFIVFMNKTDDFMNEVSALSARHKCNNFKIKNLKFDSSLNKKLQFLLSTDGISEDIKPDRREDFFNYFLDLNKDKTNRGLIDELKNWDVVGSVDDKTIVTFDWRG